MTKCSNTIKYLILFFATAYCFVSSSGYAAEIAHLSFPKEEKSELRINGELSVPPFSQKNKKYKPISFSTLTPNVISYGKTNKTVSLDKIQPNDFITINIGEETYQIDLFSQDMPTYQITKNVTKPGYLLLTPFKANCHKPSYAYIVHTNGDLLWFRRNPQNERCVSDFKKTTLPDGKVRYSLMEQEKRMPPFGYWSGSLLIMDEKLQPLKRVKLQPTQNHPEIGVENHDSLILGDNHYILTAYHQKEVIIQGQEQPARVAALIIQEVKDDKVIFEWDSTYYPELYESCLFQCNYKAVPYQDYIHFNTVIVDDKDNNLIVSLGAQSSIIKIDRKSGKILWRLGGLKDDFKLEENHRFVSQHTVSLLSKDRLMLLDNHSNNLLNKKRGYKTSKINTNARILIFSLDEKKLKLKKFRQINLPYPIYSMGSVYKTENNTFMVGYGAFDNVAAQEISAAGEPIFELRLKDKIHSYRVQKYNRLD